MQSPSQITAPPKKSNNLLKQLICLVIGVLLLWLSFRGCDFGKLWEVAKHANLLFMFLVCFSAVVSHILRAWRWIYLLKPLSDKVSLWNSFCAVIIGYAVNIAVPRGGEVARLISISKSENLPWMGVLPTMFIDRLLDIAMLGILFGMTLTQLPKEILDKNPALVPGGIALSIGGVLALCLLPHVAKIMKWIANQKIVASRLPEKAKNLIDKLTEQFEIGTKSLTDATAYPAIAALTFAIWFAYWLNNYLMVYALGLNDKVSMSQSLVVFTIGSMGVLVPTPGSVGSFHYLVSQTLQVTCGLDPNTAMAYATVLHILCFIVAVCVPALVCWLIQQSTARAASVSSSKA